MKDHDYSGTILDEQYRVNSLIGEGSMGTVYLGQNLNTGSQVAIKILHASLLENESSIKRFFREARAAVEISHENIINVIDVGLSAFDEPYIVMEYLEGETLAAMLKRVGRVDLRTARSIVEPLLHALNAIHEKGIVHRDIKPEKIFLVRRQTGAPLVKLIDFGLSKFTESSTATMLTVAGTVIGDVAYISPEQARGDKNVDRRTDIYAVGMILYRLLAGRLPFDSTKYHEILIAKMSGKLKQPQEAYSGFPEEAVAFVWSCLSRDPIERPQNALEMIQGLRTLQHAGIPSVIPENIPSSGSRRPLSGSFQDGKATDEIEAPTKHKQTGIIQIFQKSWKERSKTLFIGLGAVAALMLILVIALVASSSGGESEQIAQNSLQPANENPIAPGQDVASTSPQETASAPQQTDVQIELRGLPQDATIYYNGAKVPVNPFRVSLKEVIIPLKVEAAGYETYLTHLVPSENQVVRVEMKPLAPDGENMPAGTNALDDPAMDPERTGDEEVQAESNVGDPSPAASPSPVKRNPPREKKKSSGGSKKKSSRFMHEFD